MAKQQGFTLIELVMVIVILGILTTTALPRFANLQGNAKYAKLSASLAAIKSAATIVHSQAIIAGVESVALSSVTLEGSSIEIVNGYPSNEAILIAAGLDQNEFDLVEYTTHYLAFIYLGSCFTIYSEATSSSPPVFRDIGGVNNGSC